MAWPGLPPRAMEERKGSELENDDRNPFIGRRPKNPIGLRLKFQDLGTHGSTTYVVSTRTIKAGPVACTPASCTLPCWKQPIGPSTGSWVGSFSLFRLRT